MKLVVTRNSLWSLSVDSLQHQNPGPLSRQKPWGRPRVLIAHLNEEKKMFGSKTRWSLEYTALLLSLSWAVYFNALYLDINSFHIFFLPKTCSHMVQIAILGVQAVSVPPQVTFMPVWILLLPEPGPLARSCDMLLPEPLPAFWPDCRGFALEWWWGFCSLAWPEFCRTSPPAMVLNANLAEMTQLTRTLICWLDICERSTAHL